MAKDSKLLYIGDILIVNVKPIAHGIMSLNGYTDELNGLTETRNVRRDFRISSDEIFFSDWLELTQENLLSQSQRFDGEFLIQIKYTRIGIDDTDFIEFIKIDFSGDFTPIDFVAPTIKQSIFSKTFDNEFTNRLAKNLFKKLYFRGIIPEYVTRGEDLDKNLDKDYIDLFSSVAKFFSMILGFCKRFENVYLDFDLLKELIRGHGIYFDESKITLEELQILSSGLFDEFRKRGTNLMFKRKGDIVNGQTIKIDGEFLRLLRNKEFDELCYELVEKDRMGWCVGKSSPIYKGTCESKLLNKTKENSKDFLDLNNFHIEAIEENSFELLEVDDKRVLSLMGGANEGKCGLGKILNEPEELTVIDSGIDYEITFWVKVQDTFNDGDSLYFGVDGYDKLGNLLTDSFILPNGNSISSQFLKTKLLNFKKGVWYKVRGILYSYSTKNIDKMKLNIGRGNNLFFNNRFTAFIQPKIQLWSYSEANILIWDYKIRPLVRGKNIMPLKNGSVNSNSLGFLQSRRLFYFYAKNNNNSISPNELKKTIEKYLLPANSNSVFVLTGNY